MYTEWRRQMRAGLKHFQDARLPLYEQTILLPRLRDDLHPGLLNTTGCKGRAQVRVELIRRRDVITKITASGRTSSRQGSVVLECTATFSCA